MLKQYLNIPLSLQVVYSKLTDLLPSAVTSEDDPELQRPSVEEIEDTTEKTRQALEKLTQVRHQFSSDPFHFRHDLLFLPGKNNFLIAYPSSHFILSYLQGKISSAMPVRCAEKQAPAQYIRYTPSQQGVSFNSGATQRVIRMVEQPKDPMEPPKFKYDW